MRGRLTKWGNSVAVRVPKRALEDAQLAEGDTLELVVVKPGVISLQATEKRLTLKSLLADITPENRHSETDWGGPVGNELW